MVKRTPAGLKYPRELVSELGAKAGILEYVRRLLPKIPQAQNVVKRPQDDVEDILARADRLGLGWPRLYRSSSIDELAGFEGDFPTYQVHNFGARYGSVPVYHSREHFEAEKRRLMLEIEHSPIELRKRGLQPTQDRICVRVDELSPSLYTGTLIKHPNRNYHVISFFDAPYGSSERHHAGYLCGQKGLYRLRDFTNIEFGNESRDLHRQLHTVSSWHDEISALPEMDAAWAYQLEFGLFPLCLYQVRPFKKIESAEISVPRRKDLSRLLVFGTTPKEGIITRVERPHSVNYVTDNDPRAYVGCMRTVHETALLPNHQVSFLDGAIGFLSHHDIKALRRTQVTVLTLLHPSPIAAMDVGELIKVTSDGERVSVVPYTPVLYSIPGVRPH